MQFAFFKKKKQAECVFEFKLLKYIFVIFTLFSKFSHIIIKNLNYP